jgi:hypothetical protein
MPVLVAVFFALRLWVLGQAGLALVVMMLTELGKQFVHYTMNEIVPRVGSGVPESQEVVV